MSGPAASASPPPLPADTHVGRVRLRVGDLGRSLAYYEGLLGFRVAERAAGRATLAAGDAPLIELQEHPGARPVAARARLGLFHFAILLPDRAALGRILARLAEQGEPLGSADHAVSEALYLTDPDGLGIEIYADRPRAEWPRRGGELSMVTEPLDTRGVLRASAGVPWAGMPAGTTIGHMHLHVGDIPSARAFYHAALGLDVTLASYPGALFLSAGGYHHHLGLNIWAGPRAGPPDADEAQLLEWELVLATDAASAAAARLAHAGHAVEREGDAAWRAADPWGTRLLLTPG